MSTNAILRQSTLAALVIVGIVPNARAQAISQMPMSMAMPQASAHHDDHETLTFGAPAIANAAARTITVTMKDLNFEPAALSVHKGEIIHFVITNTSAIDHEFVLGDSATQKEHRDEMVAMANSGQSMEHDDPNAVSVAANKTATLTWKFTRIGVVEYNCNIPGHYEQGMQGVISVR